ncbi:hypothetical protein D3C78_720380 [compost metagenome]
MILHLDAAILVALDHLISHGKALLARHRHCVCLLICNCAANHNPDFVATHKLVGCVDDHRCAQRHGVGVDHTFSVRFGNHRCRQRRCGTFRDGKGQYRCAQFLALNERDPADHADGVVLVFLNLGKGHDKRHRLTDHAAGDWLTGRLVLIALVISPFQLNNIPSPHPFVGSELNIRPVTHIAQVKAAILQFGNRYRVKLWHLTLLDGKCQALGAQLPALNQCDPADNGDGVVPTFQNLGVRHNKRHWFFDHIASDIFTRGLIGEPLVIGPLQIDNIANAHLRINGQCDVGPVNHIPKVKLIIQAQFSDGHRIEHLRLLADVQGQHIGLTDPPVFDTLDPVRRRNRTIQIALDLFQRYYQGKLGAADVVRGNLDPIFVRPGR